MPTSPRGGRGRARALAVIGVLVVIIVLLLVVYIVPFSTPISFVLSDVGTGGYSACSSHFFANNTAISFHWQTADGATVSFVVADSWNFQFYSSSASSGSGSFQSFGDTFNFCFSGRAAESVTVSGSSVTHLATA